MLREQTQAPMLTGSLNRGACNAGRLLLCPHLVTVW